jgi:hypothetical protein
MSGTAKKSNAGKIILGVVVVIAAVAALMYASMVRPFLTPKPLADAAPDTAAVVVSIDLYNAGNTAFKYIRAIGLGRFSDLMKTDEEEEEDDSGMPGKMVKLAMPWLTREVMVVGSFEDSGDPAFAVLVGSRNKGKAEKNFPKMLELIKEESAKSAEEESPEKAKKIRAQKIEFKDTQHAGVTLHCNQNPESVVGAFCWASTKRALVVSPSADMLKTVVSSINGKRTQRQKQLADLRLKDVPDNYLMYVYADRAKVLKGLDMPIADELLAKEAAAVKGALYSLAYRNLSPEVRFGLVLDDKKLKDTALLSKLVSFEPSAHRVSSRVSSEASLFYLSVNNVGDMANAALASLDKKQLADLRKDLGMDPEKVAAALGSEAAGSIIDFGAGADGSLSFKAIGALEVNDKDLIIQAAGKILKGFNPKIDIKKTADNAWEVALPAHLKLPEGMKPVIGFKDRFLYASLDQSTLDDHLTRARGAASPQVSNIHMTMNAPRAMDKLFNQLPGWSFIRTVEDFKNMYRTTELSVSCTPRMVQATLVQDVSVVGVHKLPLEKLMGKIKDQVIPPAADDKLPSLAGAIPAAPALVLAVDTNTSKAVMNNIWTALMTPERVRDTIAFVQEAKNAMGTAPEIPSADDAAAMAEEMAMQENQDWEAGTLDEFDSMEGGDDYMSEEYGAPPRVRTSVSEIMNIAKLAAIAGRSVGLLVNGGWYGGEFAMTVGGMPEREQENPEAALFISATDGKKAAATFEQIASMLVKANFPDMKIKDEGVKTYAGAEYRIYSDAASKPGQLDRPMVLIGSLKNAVVVTISEPYFKKIADASAGKGASLQDELGEDIPKSYAGFAYASGDAMAMMVQSQIDSLQEMIKMEEEWNTSSYEDYSDDSMFMDESAFESETADAAMEQEYQDETMAETADTAEPGMETEAGADMEAAADVSEPAADYGPLKSPAQAKLEQWQMLARELKAVRGILFVKSFDGISPRLSLDILLHKDKVAGTDYISKLYQYQSAKHQVDGLIRTGDSIMYMSISNLSDILTNVNDNVIMKSNDEGMVALRKDLELMGTSMQGIAGALGSEAGFSLMDIKFDRETFGYIPKFIAAVEVRDFEYLAKVVESAVALSNKRKAGELYEGDVEALAAAGEHMAVERRGANILAVRLPTLIQYGEDMRLLIGYSGNHAFISLDPDVLEEFMAGGKGKVAEESATFKMSVNPQQARRFAKEILFVGAEDKTKPKAIRDRERAKGEFLLNVMGIVGKGQITVRALPDRVSLDIAQDLDREAIVKLPHGQGLEWARGVMVEKNFEACSHALGYVKEGVFAYSYDQESMSYTGLDPAGANLPQYMPLFAGCSAGQCKGKVKDMVEAACEPGSFKIEVKEDGSDFIVRGKARGSDCNICTTAYFQNFNLYGECLAEPGLKCE